MPRFSNRPPDDPRGRTLELRRTPTHKPLVAIVTCENLVGTPTHFWGGRTVPCEAPNCDPCDAGAQWRWHGYVSAWIAATKEHILFEFTARLAFPFTTYFQAYGTLRGCLFQARRAKPTPNARVLLETKRIDTTKICLPRPPDLEYCLCTIWGIPANQATTDGTMKNAPRIHVAAPGDEIAQALQPAPKTPDDENGRNLPSATGFPSNR